MKAFIVALAMVFMYFLAFVAFNWLISIIFTTDAFIRFFGAAGCTIGLLMAHCITAAEMER